MKGSEKLLFLIQKKKKKGPAVPLECKISEGFFTPPLFLSPCCALVPDGPFMGKHSEIGV